ncbi:MAG: Sfum_1244 family protein [Pseudomonadota bacterium]
MGAAFKPELNLGPVVSAVQANCHISDAQFAGDLTMCTFLLKMRELYRWENQLPFTGALSKSAIGDWMSEREKLWEGVEAASYVPLPLPGGAVDPFEVDAINGALAPRGYIYSGGYGRACKPHFFLAELARQEDRHGFHIYVSDCEYARDLDAPPGMLLNDSIFVRTEALRRWLWERYEEWTWNKRNAALGRALASYDFVGDPEAALAAMTEAETESVILHELGEARVGSELGEAWSALLADVLRSRAEIMARAVRDLYADCLSTLPGILEQADPAVIHFYFANFTGMRRKLFPELAVAYEEWLETGDLLPLRLVVASGRQRWLDQAMAFLALHRRQGDSVGNAIEALLEPESLRTT